MYFLYIISALIGRIFRVFERRKPEKSVMDRLADIAARGALDNKISSQIDSDAYALRGDVDDIEKRLKEANLRYPPKGPKCEVSVYPLGKSQETIKTFGFLVERGACDEVARFTTGYRILCIDKTG